MDSTGLGVLIGADRRLHGLGGELVLAAQNATIRRILSVTGLDRAFRVYDALDAVSDR